MKIPLILFAAITFCMPWGGSGRAAVLPPRLVASESELHKPTSFLPPNLPMQVAEAASQIPKDENKFPNDVISSSDIREFSFVKNSPLENENTAVSRPEGQRVVKTPEGVSGKLGTSAANGNVDMQLFHLGKLIPGILHNLKTTTTISPINDYCSQACKMGIAGPECGCPSHPIG